MLGIFKLSRLASGPKGVLLVEASSPTRASDMRTTASSSIKAIPAGIPGPSGGAVLWDLVSAGKVLQCGRWSIQLHVSFCVTHHSPRGAPKLKGTRWKHQETGLQDWSGYTARPLLT